MQYLSEISVWWSGLQNVKCSNQQHLYNALTCMLCALLNTQLTWSILDRKGKSDPMHVVICFSKLPLLLFAEQISVFIQFCRSPMLPFIPEQFLWTVRAISTDIWIKSLQPILPCASLHVRCWDSFPQRIQLEHFSHHSAAVQWRKKCFHSPSEQHTCKTRSKIISDSTGRLRILIQKKTID